MTKPVTLLFPGQGSQYVGMGKSLPRDLFQRAEDILGLPLSRLCLEGPEDELKKTSITQPALLTHSITLVRELEKRGVAVERVMGHSVGEYAALVAAGALSFDDALLAVHKRGLFMQESAGGKMIALLKMPEEMILRACENATQANSLVVPANFNGPDQIVISGNSDACDRALTWLEANSGQRVRAIELPVSAAFHSPLMTKAQDQLAAHLSTLSFHPLRIPYIANIDATEYAIDSSGEIIRDNLIAQVCGSVRWTHSLAKLSDSTVALEVGPGKVLTGIMAKTNASIRTLALDSETAFNELKDFIQ